MVGACTLAHPPPPSPPPAAAVVKKRGQISSTIADLTKRIAQDPQAEVLYLQRAALFRARGDYEQACSDYAQASVRDSFSLCASRLCALLTRVLIQSVPTPAPPPCFVAEVAVGIVVAAFVAITGG